MPSLMATIGLNASGLNRAATAVKNDVRQLGGMVKSAFGSVAGQVAAGLSIDRMIQAGGQILELGGKVQDLSNKLGISTDAVQQWDYALKQNGSSIEAAVPFFQRLSQARQEALEGSDKAIADFQRLGVSMDMLKSKRPDEIAKVIAKGFEDGDPQQLIAPLVNVGGRGAMAMAAAFRDGLADALGEAPIVPPKDIEALDRAADEWGKLKADATATFAPLLAGIFEFVNGAVNIVEIFLGKFVGQLQGAFEAISSMSAGDLLSPVETGKKIGKAISEGGKEGMAAVQAMHAEEQAAADAKRQRLARGNQGAFDPEAILAAKENAEREKSEKSAQAKLKKDAEKEATAEKKLFDSAEKQQEKEALDAARAGKHSVGGLQQMGGFLGNFAAAAGPEVAAATATIRSERHLADILKELRKKANGGGGTSEETEY